MQLHIIEVQECTYSCACAFIFCVVLVKKAHQLVCFLLFSDVPLCFPLKDVMHQKKKSFVIVKWTSAP